jgi:hypothetical protein
MWRAFLRLETDRAKCAYFGGAGVNTSRLLGSGLGFGLGAFFCSFLPLSLLPMIPSMTQIHALVKPKPVLNPLRQRLRLARHCACFVSDCTASPGPSITGEIDP